MANWTQADLDAKKAPKSPVVSRSPDERTSVPPAPPRGRSAKEIAKEQEARRQVVGYGRRADTNTTFGCAVYLRQYRVLHPEEADELDKEFYRITNTQP